MCGHIFHSLSGKEENTVARNLLPLVEKEKLSFEHNFLLRSKKEEATFERMVHRLVFDSALFEPTLGFFRIEALALSKNLDVHLTPPASRPPLPSCRQKTGTRLLPNKPQYDL